MPTAIKDTQDWLAAYLELCTLVKADVTEIKHIDLWHEQLMFEAEEYPFPVHSLFMDFNAIAIETNGLKVQDMVFSIGFLHVFDTLSDTFDGSSNQAVALEFGAVLRKIHRKLQGLSGTNFSSLNRTGFAKESVPFEGIIAYRQTYQCIIRDYAAFDDTEETDLEELDVKLEITKGVTTPEPDTDLYTIPT